jgi:hypothetical protein
MCRALDDYGDYPRCIITEEQRGYNFPIREKRMDRCPLIELPPHGRLKDVDKIEYEKLYIDDVGKSYEMVGKDDIDELPTVIEAERSET